ncbi:MAG: transcription termination factor NusA [Victivallales bacterium]|nr:transcription termination factor NusA [Victivallales bacterium]MBR6057964.1 transcription termination factor NusA [Victivallales bacterium]
MKNNELINSLDQLERERGIDRETLLEAIEESLQAAARRAVCASREVSVKIDRKTGVIHCCAKLLIVEKVEHPEDEIALKKVQEKYPERNYTTANLGEEIEWEVKSEEFGRIAAQNAKQIIVQKLRQVEKKNICESYKDQLNTLITGEVRRIDRNEIDIMFDQAEGAMRYSDKIPGEEYEVGDMVVALLTEINSDKPGPTLYVSRACTEFVVKLFEREVSEIAEGLVQIKAVSREAGYRTKIAVASNDPKVDPVGACVGVKGSRVKIIVRELAGEKVDIIHWDSDIRKFVENALKPAKLSSITVNEARKSIKIEVPEDQLSLSIGKKGQNARLASKLTGWKIDIVKAENVAPAEPNFEEQRQNAIDALAAALDLKENLAKELVFHGFINAAMVADADVKDLAALEGFDHDSAATLKAVAAATVAK